MKNKNKQYGCSKNKITTLEPSSHYKNKPDVVLNKNKQKIVIKL